MVDLGGQIASTASLRRTARKTTETDRAARETPWRGDFVLDNSKGRLSHRPVPTTPSPDVHRPRTRGCVREWVCRRLARHYLSREWSHPLCTVRPVAVARSGAHGHSFQAICAVGVGPGQQPATELKGFIGSEPRGPRGWRGPSSVPAKKVSMKRAFAMGDVLRLHAAVAPHLTRHEPVALAHEPCWPSCHRVMVWNFVSSLGNTQKKDKSSLGPLGSPLVQ